MNDSFLIGGDLRVRRLGFGALHQYADATDPGAHAILRRAVELGVDLIDTADCYGASEEAIAAALRPYPKSLVIATKGGLTNPTWGENVPDGRPAHLRAALEGSLRRLHLERVDLYQLHTVDPKVPIVESVGALAELQREGKIRHLGLCNVSPALYHAARSVATIASVQNACHYGRDNRLLDETTRDGVAFIAMLPLGSGALAKGAAPEGRTPAQHALAWLLHRAPNVIPIPGTGNLAHLEENMRAREIALSPEER